MAERVSGFEDIHDVFDDLQQGTATNLQLDSRCRRAFRTVKPAMPAGLHLQYGRPSRYWLPVSPDPRKSGGPRSHYDLGVMVVPYLPASFRQAANLAINARSSARAALNCRTDKAPT